MEAPTFEESVRERAGLLDGPRFRVALRSALTGLAGQLKDAKTHLRPAVGSELLARMPTTDRRERPSATLQEVYLGVALTARVGVGVAIQIVQAVVAEVARRLGPSRCQSLTRELSPAWGDLVVAPAAEEASRAAREARRPAQQASRQAE